MGEGDALWGWLSCLLQGGVVVVGEGEGVGSVEGMVWL